MNSIIALFTYASTKTLTDSVMMVELSSSVTIKKKRLASSLLAVAAGLLAETGFFTKYSVKVVLKVAVVPLPGTTAVL